MKTLSQLIEEKKRYYSQMDDIIKPTSREIVLSKFGLALSDFFKDWNASSTHTYEQAFAFFKIFFSCMANAFSSEVSTFNSAPNFGETDEEAEEEDVLNTVSLGTEEEEDGNEENCDVVIQDEDVCHDEEKSSVEEDFVKSVENVISEIEEKLGIEKTEFPDCCFSLAILFGLIYPYFKLHDFVQNSKVEFSNELVKKGYTPELIDDFKTSILSDGDTNLLVDCMADVDADIFDNRSYTSDIAEIGEKIKVLQKTFSAEDEDKDTTALVKQAYQFVLDLIEKGATRIVLFMKGLDYLCDKLSAKEKEAFDSILSQPEFKSILSQWVEEYDQVILEKEVPFSLPANYFTHLDPSPNKDEYLQGSLFDRTRDVYKFVSLINYIADRGFIENNLYTKKLLAFRLTGRMRPEGYLPKIKWTGRAKQGADCLFLMKCYGPNNPDKFDRMAKFFDADFPQKDLSSYVHNAGKAFMVKLNELFPEIYELPNKYKS